jgi:hypothetical protein
MCGFTSPPPPTQPPADGNVRQLLQLPELTGFCDLETFQNVYLQLHLILHLLLERRSDVDHYVIITKLLESAFNV